MGEHQPEFNQHNIKPSERARKAHRFAVTWTFIAIAWCAAIVYWEIELQVLLGTYAVIFAVICLWRSVSYNWPGHIKVFWLLGTHKATRCESGFFLKNPFYQVRSYNLDEQRLALEKLIMQDSSGRSVELSFVIRYGISAPGKINYSEQKIANQLRSKTIRIISELLAKAKCDDSEESLLHRRNWKAFSNTVHEQSNKTAQWFGRTISSTLVWQISPASKVVEKPSCLKTEERQHRKEVVLESKKHSIEQNSEVRDSEQMFLSISRNSAKVIFGACFCLVLMISLIPGDANRMPMTTAIVLFILVAMGIDWLWFLIMDRSTRFTLQFHERGELETHITFGPFFLCIHKGKSARELQLRSIEVSDLPLKDSTGRSLHANAHVIYRTSDPEGSGDSRVRKLLKDALQNATKKLVFSIFGEPRITVDASALSAKINKQIENDSLSIDRVDLLTIEAQPLIDPSLLDDKNNRVIFDLSMLPRHGQIDIKVVSETDAQEIAAKRCRSSSIPGKAIVIAPKGMWVTTSIAK